LRGRVGSTSITPQPEQLFSSFTSTFTRINIVRYR
jgi:hypothetical protein